MAGVIKKHRFRAILAQVWQYFISILKLFLILLKINVLGHCSYGKELTAVESRCVACVSRYSNPCAHWTKLRHEPQRNNPNYRRCRILAWYHITCLMIIRSNICKNFNRNLIIR